MPVGWGRAVPAGGARDGGGVYNELFTMSLTSSTKANVCLVSCDLRTPLPIIISGGLNLGG